MSLEPVRVFHTPLEKGDPTRRWGVGYPDGTVLFAGLTLPEVDRYAPLLADIDDPHECLAVVHLDALLSDGAGPHLLTADGNLVIALGAHPIDADLTVVMGDVGTQVLVGVARARDEGVWLWHARAIVTREDRVAALDRLVESTSDTLDRWQRAPLYPTSRENP